MPGIVSLDQGSSSSRALWVDGKGRIRQRAQFPLGTRYPAAGFVEHEAEEIWNSQKRALEQVLSKGRTPDSLAIATQRSTVLFWDARTGRPAAPAMSWQDGRAQEDIRPIQFQRDLQEWVHARTGLVLTPYYSAPKIAWALRHLKRVRQLADSGQLRIGPVGTYLVWKLTGGEVFAVDPTLAQRTLLFDIDRQTWDLDLVKRFGVPLKALPRILPSQADWGEARLNGQRIPIRAVMGDQQAAAFGLGVAREGEGAINYGTGAFLMLHTGARRARIPGILNSVALQDSEGRSTYLAEGTVHAVDTCFKWLKTNLGLLKDLREVDRLWKRSKRRVWCLPAIGGLGAPRWDYQTPTSFFGLDSQTRQEDLVRAVGEGIAFLLADIAHSVKEAGFVFKGIRASGGLSRLRQLVQFQADLLQIPIRLIHEKEATALGAASLAGLRFPSQKTGDLVRPRMKANDAKALHAAWQAFVHGTQQLASRLGPGVRLE